mgnify:CR=1 FL=1
MSGFLHKQEADENSTYAGSVILEDLRAELFAADRETLVFNSASDYTPDTRRQSVVESEWNSGVDLPPNNIGLQSSRRTLDTDPVAVWESQMMESEKLLYIDTF